MRAFVIGFVMGVVLVAAGCEGGDENFISCSLDPKVVELGQCLPEDSEELTDGTIQNCAIDQHPLPGGCLPRLAGRGPLLHDALFRQLRLSSREHVRIVQHCRG